MVQIKSCQCHNQIDIPKLPLEEVTQAATCWRKLGHDERIETSRLDDGEPRPVGGRPGAVLYLTL